MLYDKAYVKLKDKLFWSQPIIHNTKLQVILKLASLNNHDWQVSNAYCVNTYLVQFNLLCIFLFIVRFELQYIASVYSLIFYKYFVIGHKRHLIQRPFIFIVVWRTIWREITLIVITPICMYNVYFREMEITFLPDNTLYI